MCSIMTAGQCKAFDNCEEQDSEQLQVLIEVDVNFPGTGKCTDMEEQDEIERQHETEDFGMHCNCGAVLIGRILLCLPSHAGRSTGRYMDGFGISESRA